MTNLFFSVPPQHAAHYVIFIDHCSGLERNVILLKIIVDESSQSCLKAKTSVKFDRALYSISHQEKTKLTASAERLIANQIVMIWVEVYLVSYCGRPLQIELAIYLINRLVAKWAGIS